MAVIMVQLILFGGDAKMNAQKIKKIVLIGLLSVNYTCKKCLMPFSLIIGVQYITDICIHTYNINTKDRCKKQETITF